MTLQLESLHVESLNVEAKPLLLAQRVWDQECPALLWTQTGNGPSYIACNPVAHSFGLDPEPELQLGARLGSHAHVPRWFGVLPYEDERARLERSAFTPAETRPTPLIARAQWWRYPAVACIQEGRVSVVGDDPKAVRQLAECLTRGKPCSLDARVELLEQNVDLEAHRRRIVQAKERIFAGDLYEVNLARRLELQVEGNALGLLEQIGRWAKAEYAAALVMPDGCEVISTSPELFLELGADRTLRTLPIKGTRPRGVDAEADRQIAAELDADPKERAELAMVIDIERNDLGRVAELGSVRASAPYVTRLQSVFHRQAEVSARLLPDLDRLALLRATLPSGSVTGAPKVRAMEIIAELESERRGLYTGAFGFVGQDGGLELAMAIRTLQRRGSLAHYFVGGGIVADSDPDREVLETDWKALQIYKTLSTR
jgi:anthranilate/para-aminobenzoate synthase component I